MKTKLTGIFLFLLALTGCVKETLDKCPEGNVRINVYAEKFQTNSSAASQDVEEQIGKRIQFLHCILYKDNDYVMDTIIEDISGVNTSLYPIDFRELPFGNYNLLVVGNCSPDAMEGDFHQLGGLNLLYLGVDQTEDLFATLLPFTVDCDCSMQFEAKLRRLLGVVRCGIKGLPEEITELEFLFHHVNSRVGKGGIYDKPIDVSKRISVTPVRSTKEKSVLMGIFPTTTNSPVSYELKLYAPHQEEAVFDKVMSDQVNIIRNQLIELITDFSDGEPSFTIRMNTKWEDYVNGGEVEIF